MKIAEVIINIEVKSLDRVFHYLVDDSTEILPGARVLVPFGFGNTTTIGYFIGFIDSSPYKNLKTIKKVVDNIPLIDEKGIELAKFVSKTTFSSMSDSLKLLLPPAINFKFEYIVKYTGKNYEKLTKTQTKVLDTLKAVGGSAEQKKLMLSCGVKSTSVINSLKKDGYIEIIEKTIGGNKEKTRKKVYLTENYEDKLKTFKLGSAMKKAIELLSNYDGVYLSELVSFSGCSSASVTSLENKGILFTVTETVDRIETKNVSFSKAKTPSPEQKTCIDKLKSAIDKNEKSEHLLFGVTGSGKTEVFLQCADYCIKQGKNVIILVPEISLTPQMTKRFGERFGSSIAVLHSGLSLGERYDQWQKIRNNMVKVVVGARSAIFAPFDNIGLIVIDEEHENTYKSESNPRYDAREIARFRGAQHGCPVVFASATPRVSDYYLAKTGKINLLKLDSRICGGKLPRISVVDMSKELADGNRSVLSRIALDELKLNMKSGMQSLVFLNRRGFSTFVSCRSCGYVAKCPNCSVSLTYHAKGEKLKCHMCGYEQDNLSVCPSCMSKYIKYFGSGTQKAEDIISSELKQAHIVRMDGDTTSHKFSHERLLDEFASYKNGVLLGTQMITKGLDFHSITLSVVIAADSLLNTGEYSGSERAFSQLVQVCGRAGRGEKEGRAIIQTYEPQNKVFKYIINNDYEGFYEDEIKSRKLMEYPPFAEIISIVVSGDDEEKTGIYGMKIENRLRKLLTKYDNYILAFFGLSPCRVFKVKNKFRYKITLKIKKDEFIYDVLKTLNTEHLERGERFILDIDIAPNI